MAAIVSVVDAGLALDQTQGRQHGDSVTRKCWRLLASVLAGEAACSAKEYGSRLAV